MYFFKMNICAFKHIKNNKEDAKIEKEVKLLELTINKVLEDKEQKLWELQGVHWELSIVMYPLIFI